ncbi:unnamed protein product, partial [Pylaiella littoralis]
MWETKARRDFVENPRIVTAVEQLPSLEGRDSEHQGRGPPEMESSIDRSLFDRSSMICRELSPVESGSAGGDDLDLERYFSQEMDAMDSCSDSDSNGSLKRAFEEEPGQGNERKVLETTHLNKGFTEDACASTLEWSQFLESTAEVFQYMEEAKAETLEVCSLAPHSPHQDHKTHD